MTSRRPWPVEGDRVTKCSAVKGPGGISPTPEVVHRSPPPGRGCARSHPGLAPRLAIFDVDSTRSWLHPFWAFGLPIALSFPIGWIMARVLDVPTDRAGRGFDALPMALLRLIGRREPTRMDWKRYAVALLAFNAALFVL